MTYDEFLAKLRETPRKWYLAGKCIRCEHPRLRDVEMCPISSLEDEDSALWPLVALRVNLDLRDANCVVRAADNADRSAIRTALLAACGLTERTA